MKNTKKVVINAVGIKEAFAGIGNLTLNLFDKTAEITRNCEYHIYVNSRLKNRFTYRSHNVTIHPVNIMLNSTWLRIFWDQFIFPVISWQYQISIAMMNIGTVFGKRNQIVFMYDLSEINMPERFSISKRIYFRLLRKKSIKCASKIITISEHSNKDLIKHYPITEGKVVVVPLGGKYVQKARLVNRVISESYFLFVSTIEPGKNLPRLISAFIEFRKEYPSIKLKIVGAKSWGYPEVRFMIEKNNLSEYVQCLGYISEDDLELMYSNALGFVFPSLYEGFGLPVLEAMQYDLPILTSNVSSLPEVGGDAVVYCDPFSVSDIVKGLKKLLLIDRKTLTLSYTKQLSSYTWENGAKIMAGVIGSMLR